MVKLMSMVYLLVTWESWSAFTQQKWLEDYYRTQEQATYYQDSDYAKVYHMKETVDSIAARTLKTGGDLVENVKDTTTNVFGLGVDILMLGAIALLLSR